jgi:hypothetical protein
MPLQTTFSFTHDPAVAGMEYGSGLCQINTAIATEDLPLGAAVNEIVESGNLQEQGRKYAALPGNGNGNFLGVVCHRHIEKDPDSKRTPVYQVASNETSEYRDGEACPVGVFGRFWVEVTEAVSPGDSVWLHNSSPDKGKFNTSAGIDISTQARWITSTSGAGLAVVEINNIA